jgi:hypothetical protein
MTRWLPGCLILVFLAAAIGGQESPSKKADEPGKSNSATAKKLGEPPVDPVDSPTTGGKVWISLEKYKELEDRYQKLREQFAALERQIKKEKSPPSECKLSGRIDGETAVLRAEFQFTTFAPQSIVFLGLKNGYLVDEGQWNDGVPHLESTEDGYLVRIDKEGSHRLTLNVRVPVLAKRSAAPAAGNERGFDLGLPGAAVTALALELPAGAKDLRWNDIAAAPKRPGYWDIKLGAPKNLAVSWKEPVATPNVALAPSAKANLKVKFEEGRIELSGELVLEDAKNPLRQWQLLLPAQVKVAPALGSAEFTWTPPQGKSNVHVIKLTEPADKVTLSLQAQYARTQPQQKLPIGPFLVQGTTAQGTILIQQAPGALRGQGLLYHPYGEIFPRNPPKAPAGVDNLAQFSFWNAPFSGKSLSPTKASLEVEWRTEKGQIEASVEHEVKLRENHGQWFVEVDSRFLMQSGNAAVDTLDLQVPAPTYPELLWLGVQPHLGIPAALRWPVALAPRPAFPLLVTVTDDGGIIDIPPADAKRRVRLKLLTRPAGKEFVVKAKSLLLAPGDANRFRVELPKLFGVLDRGAKITVLAPPGQELLVGPRGQPEPVPDKYEQSLEQMPALVELAWRGSQRERLARAVADIVVREHTMHVRQTLILSTATWSGGATQTGQLALRLPAPGFAFSTLNDVPRLSSDKLVAWIKLPPDIKGTLEIPLEYDVPIAKESGAASTAVPLLWPEAATSRDAKLRVWTEPGVTPTLAGLGSIWMERPIEEGPAPGMWPALVAAGIGPTLPVSLQFDQSAGHRLPALVADRSLIQVRIDDDGSQNYRCRYVVRKFSASSLDVDLPISWEQAQPHFRVAGKEVGGVKVVDPLRNRVRVPLAPQLYPQPVSFEITYHIPSGQGEGKRSWQTPLSPPRFEGDAVFGPTRWQVGFSGNQMPLVAGALVVDYRWGMHGWLLSPTRAASGGDLEAWIGSNDSGDNDGVTWWRSTAVPERIYHFSRPFWMVLCSGATLVLGMCILLTPLPRFALGVIVLLVGVALVFLALFHDYVLASFFMGCQPGIVVLAIVGLVQWALQERQRRQLVFTPTFARVPQGSTVIRSQGKPPRDPSTIDAPTAGPGSVKSTGH